jgi:hypothetical protein
MNMYKDGDKVALVRLTHELEQDGLTTGQTGTVRDVDGQLGVEFDGYSDTGWNAGLHVIKLNTRADNGSIVPILHLCKQQ